MDVGSAADVLKVFLATIDSIRRGFILPEDGKTIVREAVESSIGR